MQVIEERHNKELEYVFLPFFDKKPTSLLIRGLPGAGKTTLALELLRLVKDRYKPLYISTRVSLSRLQIQFPWIKGLIQEDDIFSSSEINNKSEALDMRLSTAKGTMENVMNALTESKNRFIILDSWDALAKETQFEERIKMEKTMVTMADANDGFLLFISEEPEKNTLAYVTDAVISLTAEDRYGFRIRKMIIDKMRTQPIKYNTRLYTLLDTRFILLPPMQSINPNNIAYACNTTNIFNYIGFKEGIVILVESTLGVDTNIINMLLAPLIVNNLKNKKPALVINSPDKLYTDSLQWIKPCCTDEELERLAIFTFINKTDLLDKPKVVAFDEHNIDKNTNVFISTYNTLCKEFGNPAIITYDVGLREMAHPNNIDRFIAAINAHVKAVRHNGDILVIITKHGLKTAQYVKSIADVHINIWKENGLPLCIIEKPTLGMYALLFNKEKFYDMIDLM
ncbi:MAG: hypothetical protein KatS3mg003_1633 [Candidatus Nitrosocaldaceae archaeon]|nr:MAG: hypothetical protein KatS3mg003_0395 [Candidatus Nitrosocaldaceae archaeon]GIU72154.1 MAG: hypothetical protein KatS3mg003_1633 [Candidatus Nitrosocaldaceae archaeon]